MEVVGARLGRSSTRYGPATVFTGPVRRWKKKWIHVAPPNSNNNNVNSRHQAAANGTTNGNNGSHLLLFKWTPITATQNNNGNGKANGDNNEDLKTFSKEDALATDEPPKRKFKYIPVAVLEEQTNEGSEQVEGEAKPMETDTKLAEPSSKYDDGFDEKPDINDVPAEESEVPASPLERQDLNESTLDLSLGFKSQDRENDSDSKIDQTKEGQMERLNSN